MATMTRLKTLKRAQKRAAFWEKTQKENEKYANATPAEKRVLAAQDAIKWVELGFLIPEHDGYAIMSDVDVPDDVLDDFVVSENLQEHVVARIDRSKSCSVCAAGGLLTAHVLRFNEFYTTCSDDEIHLDEHHINDGLDFFNEGQVAMIEAAYEHMDDAPLAQNLGIEDQMEAAVDFGLAIDSDKKRFIAIMRNIIENKGEFKP